MAISCARKSTRGISPDSPPPTPQSATCRHCQPVEAIVKPPEAAAKPPASRRSIGLLTKSVVSAVTTRISSIVARHPALDSNDTEKPMESQPSIETQPPITVRPVQSTRLHIPFQKFPPEIRDEIYRYVLLSTEDEDEDEDWEDWGPTGPDVCCLSLLLVSKQIYLEAFHIYYRYRNLKFSDSFSLSLFLKNIGDVRRYYVTRINFNWTEYATPELYDLLRRCPNLRFLDIHIYSVGPPFGSPRTMRTARNAVYPDRHTTNTTHVNALCDVRGLEVVRFFDRQYVYDDPQDYIAEKDQSHVIGDDRGGFEIDVSKPWSHFEATGMILDPREWDQVVKTLTLLRNEMTRPRVKKYQAPVDLKMDLFKPRPKVSEPPVDAPIDLLKPRKGPNKVSKIKKPPSARPRAGTWRYNLRQR